MPKHKATVKRKLAGEALAYEAARLYYEVGLDQTRVARQLAVSRSYVSRLLTAARQSGLVEIHLRHPLPVAEELQRELLLRFRLSEARVLARQGPEDDQALRGLGGLAARYLESQLRPGDVLDISWGTAVNATVEAFDPHPLLGVKVVQIVGGLGASDPMIDGSELARRLAEKLGGGYRTVQAPLLVENGEVRAALLREPSIRQVLNLARTAHIALVGIGTCAPAHSSLLRAGFVTESDLQLTAARGAVGDICGAHFDIQGRYLDLPLNDRVVGIEFRSLKRLPCVVGVAAGVDKAAPILGALRGRLIQVLITDDRAAQEVLRLETQAA